MLPLIRSDTAKSEKEFFEMAESLTEERNEEIKTEHQLTQPFLLFVGTREPRKNLKRIIEAWQPLAKEYQLVIVGEEGWDESGKEATALQTAGRLRFLGKVSDEVLSVAYGEAEALVFPSLYEGFGLPILEAFYHGTPVITSNVSSMPEVAGNAAELVDPLSVETIRKGIKTILNETPKQQQTRLQKMIIRLQLFNWDRVAEETERVYRLAANR